MADGDDILRVVGISKAFGGLQAVDRASLRVRRGSVTGLIGPNGAGKSTLFDIISGFTLADAGEAIFGAVPVAGYSPHRLARLGLVRTFQISRVVSAMTVLENVLIGAQQHPGERLSGAVAGSRTWRKAEHAARGQALEILQTLDLWQKRDDYAGTLSGGQRRLLELARVLMSGPRLVLLDEPLAGVNPALRERLLEHICTLRDERNLSFLLIEHDVEAVMRTAETVFVMAHGRMIMHGAPAAVRQSTEVIEAYLGDAAEVTGDR